MDSIGMKGYIMDVESDTSHVFIAHSTFFGSPLECSFHGVLDFIQKLDTLGDIDKQIWSVGFWTKAPNLGGISLIPLEIINENSCSFF